MRVLGWYNLLFSAAAATATYIPICPWLQYGQLLPQGPSRSSPEPLPRREQKLELLNNLGVYSDAFKPAATYAVTNGMLLAAMVGGNHNHKNDADLDWVLYKSVRSVCQCYVNAIHALCPIHPNIFKLYGHSWWVPIPKSKDLGNVGNVVHYKSRGLIEFARSPTGASWFRGNLIAAREFDKNNDDQVTKFELMQHLKNQGVVTAEFLYNVPRCMVTNAALHINETIHWFKNVYWPGTYTPNFTFLDRYRQVQYTKPCRDGWTDGEPVPYLSDHQFS